MKVTPTNIPDVLIIEPEVFCDHRGFFFESFSQQAFNKAVGQDIQFVQDNHSHSTKGVLRGLHYQRPPKAQGKLVRVVRGEVFDVAVDIRKSSPTFGQCSATKLSEYNNIQVWIPKGFAHGFLVLTDTAEVLYKTTDYYSPENERTLCWDDPEIQVDWPLKEPPSLSEKDAIGELLANAEVFA